MQKIERKFLIIIILLIILVIWATIYLALVKRKIDRNSYVELISWTAELNNIQLTINEREKLEIDDIIKTTSNDALAIIEWWDWSVTRLWGNSELKISNLFVSNTKDKINISFELLKWKSWSNVVSFIPDDSYFIQRFMDTEAAVRWTIFNVDLDKNYLYVVENKVQVSTNSWEKILVNEQNPLDLKTFTFIKLDEFIRNVKDTTFDSMNRVMDSELYKKMQEEVSLKMQNLIDYTKMSVDYWTDVEKNEFYKRLLASYQDVNFLWSDSNEQLYEYKIKLKEKLIEFAPEEDKQALLNSYINDFKESVNLNNNEIINSMLEAFIKNKNDLTESMTNSIWQYSLEIKVPSWLKESFMKNIEDIWSLLNKQK